MKLRALGKNFQYESFRKSNGASDGDLEFDPGLDLQGHLNVKSNFLNGNPLFVAEMRENLPFQGCKIHTGLKVSRRSFEGQRSYTPIIWTSHRISCIRALKKHVLCKTSRSPASEGKTSRSPASQGKTSRSPASQGKTSAVQRVKARPPQSSQSRRDLRSPASQGKTSAVQPVKARPPQSSR